MKSGLDFIKFLGILAIAVAIVAGIINLLFSNASGAKMVPMLVKSISTVNQSVMLARAQHDIDFSGATDYCQDDVKEVKKEALPENTTFCAIFNTTLKNSLFWGKVSDVKYYVGGKVLRYVLNGRDIIPQSYRDYYAYTLKDGALIAFDTEAAECFVEDGSKAGLNYVFFSHKAKNHLKHCVGFIDVNGYLPPNKEVTCEKGTNEVSLDESGDCVVNMRGNKLGDVYPVAFFNSSVELASNAAKFVVGHQK